MAAEKSNAQGYRYDETSDPRMIETVVMSGGAPQSPLMAGFLHALWTAKKTFRKFHTSGAGALMALLFIAPRDGDPGTALARWVEAGVSDEIYRALPQNFKLFHKPGPFAPMFARLAERFKIPVDESSPRPADDPVSAFMVELLAPLQSYSSRAGESLRKDPVEQVRDLWRAMWLAGFKPQERDALPVGADPIRRLREKWLTSWLTKPEDRRLYNDVVDLMFSAITPSTLSSKSLGMAAPLPFLEKLVDFDQLGDYVRDLGADAHICVNAYNMTEDARRKSERVQRIKYRTADAHWGGGKPRSRWEMREEDLDEIMEYFCAPYDPARRQEHEQRNEDHPITANGIRAAFSMPFIYPPARINDDYYSEGADHQPINFRHAETRGEYPMVLLDVLGELEDYLVRKPRDLWDSYVISIMTPVVALANLQIAEFKEDHPRCDEYDVDEWHGDLLTVHWDIPPEAQPFVMDWSYSNLSTLFRVGQEAGRKFVAKHGHRLHDRAWKPRASGSAAQAPRSQPKTA